MEPKIKIIDINSEEYPHDKNGKIHINRVLNQQGDWTDITLGFDTEYFIDLKSIKYSSNPLFNGWYNKVVNHFTQIVNLVIELKTQKITEKDFKNKLEPLVDSLKEQEGQFLGFGQTYGDGHGMGNEDVKALLTTISEIVDALSDSDIETIAELTLFFGTNIGQDKINDFITGIIFDDLEKYTKNIINNTIGYDEIHVLNANKEPIKVVLTPFDIVAPKIQTRFDGEFYDEFKPVKQALLELGSDVLYTAFGSQINDKLKNNEKLLKSDIPGVLHGLKKIKNKKLRDAFVASLLNNKERETQRRSLKKEVYIREIANKVIKAKNLTLENKKFSDVLDYCSKEFAESPRIAKQMANKVYKEIALILSESDYILNHKDYKEVLEKKKPKRIAIIITGKTPEKTINKKILLIKELDPNIDIVTFKKER